MNGTICSPLILRLLFFCGVLTNQGCNFGGAPGKSGPGLDNTDPNSSTLEVPSDQNPENNDNFALPDETLSIDDEHRGCVTVDDCRAVYIDCSGCENACTGVNAAYETTYSGVLDCSAFDGPQCDYDCHPQFGLTALRCDAGKCRVETLLE